jgi:hypothetical protein
MRCVACSFFYYANKYLHFYFNLCHSLHVYNIYASNLMINYIYETPCIYIFIHAEKPRSALPAYYVKGKVASMAWAMQSRSNRRARSTILKYYIIFFRYIFVLYARNEITKRIIIELLESIANVAAARGAAASSSVPTLARK